MMAGPLCPYCDTPIVDGDRVCRNHLCMMACLEMTRAMVAGEEGDLGRWREHYQREKKLIAEREQQLKEEYDGEKKNRV